MTHVTCRLTAKNRDQLRNPTLGNLVWATFLLIKKGEGERMGWEGVHPLPQEEKKKSRRLCLAPPLIMNISRHTIAVWSGAVDHSLSQSSRLDRLRLTDPSQLLKLLLRVCALCSQLLVLVTRARAAAVIHCLPIHSLLHPASFTRFHADRHSIFDRRPNVTGHFYHFPPSPVAR